MPVSSHCTVITTTYNCVSPKSQQREEVIQFQMAASNNGGYECEFVEASPKDFECPLCLHVTREPHLTSCCGQHFCQSCINRVLTDSKTCPFCKACPFNVFYDKKQRRKLFELQVYCTEKDRGCGWTGELGELDSHLNHSCEYTDVSCTNNCGETPQKRFLHKHLEVCPKRHSICGYCGYTATYEDVRNKHWPVCTKYPLLCPNNCGIGTVERSSLEKHLRECSLQLVQCEFGCPEDIQSKDVTKHMEENTQKHLLMVFTHLKRAMRENVEMRIKLAEKDEQVQLLQRRVLDVEKVTLLPPIEVTVHNFSWYEGKNKRWDECPPFFTHFMGARTKFTLWMANQNQVHVELWHLSGEFDWAITWPMRYTITLQILNQSGSKNNLQFSQRFELRGPVEEKMFKDFTQIPSSTLRQCRRDVQYVKDDSLRIRINIKVH